MNVLSTTDAAAFAIGYSPCAPTPQGSARVIQCLQDARERLGVYCRAALFDFEQDMAEDIDFKAPLKVTQSTVGNFRVVFPSCLLA